MTFFPPPSDFGGFDPDATRDAFNNPPGDDFDDAFNEAFNDFGDALNDAFGDLGLDD